MSTSGHQQVPLEMTTSTSSVARRGQPNVPAACSATRQLTQHVRIAGGGRLPQHLLGVGLEIEDLRRRHLLAEQETATKKTLWPTPGSSTPVPASSPPGRGASVGRRSQTRKGWSSPSTRPGAGSPRPSTAPCPPSLLRP